MKVKLIKRKPTTEIQEERKNGARKNSFNFCPRCSPADLDFDFGGYEHDFLTAPDPLVEFEVPPGIMFEIPMDSSFEREATVFCKKFCKLQDKKMNGKISEKQYQNQLRELWELHRFR